jgi:hypothetical protein
MTDLLTKARAALEAYEGDHTRRYELSVLSPDMARALIAAGELAAQVKRVKDFRYDPNIGIELNRLEEALTAFHAAMEGRTDDEQGVG